VIKLKKEVKTLKQTSKRRKDRVGTATSENKQLRVSLDDAFTLQDVADILVKIGGLNTGQIYSTKKSIRSILGLQSVCGASRATKKPS